MKRPIRLNVKYSRRVWPLKSRHVWLLGLNSAEPEELLISQDFHMSGAGSSHQDGLSLAGHHLWRYLH